MDEDVALLTDDLPSLQRGRTKRLATLQSVLELQHKHNRMHRTYAMTCTTLGSGLMYVGAVFGDLPRFISW